MIGYEFRKRHKLTRTHLLRWLSEQTRRARKPKSRARELAAVLQPNNIDPLIREIAPALKEIAQTLREIAPALKQSRAIAGGPSPVARPSLAPVPSPSLPAPFVPFADRLADIIETAGKWNYSIVDLAQVNEGESKIGFRYDVHIRDVPGAHEAVEAHKIGGTPGTLFLQFDYSNLERSKAEAYLDLARAALSSGMDIGLHASPVDSYFIWSMHGGESKAYANWLRTEALDYFKRASSDQALRDQIQSGIAEQFAHLVAQGRSVHPDMTLVSSHGGELSQLFIRGNISLDLEVKDFVEELRPNRWMTSSLLQKHGFVGDVDQFGAPAVYKITDGGKGFHAFHEALLKTPKPRNVIGLIHPYGWTQAGAAKRQDAGALATAPVKTTESTSSIRVVDLPFEALNLGPVDSECGPKCEAAHQKWYEWFQKAFKSTEKTFNGVSYCVPNVPLAVIKTEQSEEDYRKLIGDKSRNMLRKAERNGYQVRFFESANYLDDILAIRTSKEVRSGKPIPQNFYEQPKPFDSSSASLCERHAITGVGVFLGEQLVAYAAVHNSGEFAIINTILGHGEHLKFGVMNLLVYGVFKEIKGRYPRVRYINYLTLQSSTKELDRFKRSVGFEPVSFGLELVPQRETVSQAVVARPAVLPSGGPFHPSPINEGGNLLADLLARGDIRKILVRGDCCSYRTVAQNPEIFGKPTIVQNEKCTMQVYMDHLDGLHYPDDDVVGWSDLEKMAPSLKRYYVNQNKADILTETGADLLVIDSYADSFFQVWEHKRTKAKLWVNAKYLYDRPAFERQHIKLPYRNFNEVLVDTARYIERVRENNPGIPVLYLTHPIHYYRYLERRREFCYLGEELERFVPGVYWGTHLSKEECDPVDMDSCGPGETHHYTPATYAKMVHAAAERNPVRTVAPIVR